MKEVEMLYWHLIGKLMIFIVSAKLTCVCVITVMTDSNEKSLEKRKFRKPHTWTLVKANTLRGTDALWGKAAIRDRAHTGLYWFGVLLGRQFVCTHSECYPGAVCVSLLICEGSEGRRAEGDRREERQQRNQRAEKRDRESHRQGNMLPFSLSPIGPSLAHA